MKSAKIASGARHTLAAIALITLSGCVNQGFQMPSGSNLSPQGMRNMVLCAKYPEPAATEIPKVTRQNYESAFLAISNLAVRVVSTTGDSKPQAPYYYLNTEITKYKPGSPVGRFLMTPVIAFGLWGSYVNVDFSISDPDTDAVLGKGVIRKANLWGGMLGQSITSETQLEACPKEIMEDLDSVVKK